MANAVYDILEINTDCELQPKNIGGHWQLFH